MNSTSRNHYTVDQIVGAPTEPTPEQFERDRDVRGLELPDGAEHDRREPVRAMHESPILRRERRDRVPRPMQERVPIDDKKVIFAILSHKCPFQDSMA